MRNTMKLRSGVSIPQVTRQEAKDRHYLDRGVLLQMHLLPGGDPVAFEKSDNGSLIYYFDPNRVVEAPPEQWFFPTARKEAMTLDSGTEINRMSFKRANSCGYYTKEQLEWMHYDIIEEPVAYGVKRDGTRVFLYDKKTAVRQPLMCVKCNKFVRYKRKLCESCYAEDLAIRRAEGDLYRNKYYGMDRERVLFFDLELTGVYNHDEIISISIVDATGKVIMNTLVKPAHKKKWKETEKIHGITPEMVADAPLLDDLTEKIKEIFAGADNLIAYGVSTDYSHIKYIYDTEKERERLKKKTRCCSIEFVRYAHEHLPDLQHAALVDAMDAMNIPWDGIPHSSIADTVACMKVWEALFPHYYEKPEEAEGEL